MDYTKLSPQEKMELYLKNKSLSPEEYGKFEQNLIAKGDEQVDDKSQLGFQDYAFKDVSFLNDKNNLDKSCFFKSNSFLNIAYFN